MNRPSGDPLTAFAASEMMFVEISGEQVVVPAAAAAGAGYPHDLVETERGEALPVSPPD